VDVVGVQVVDGEVVDLLEVDSAVGGEHGRRATCRSPWHPPDREVRRHCMAVVRMSICVGPPGRTLNHGALLW
jgi:hypothetical protein